MQLKDILYISLILILIYWFYSIFYENFTVYTYNSFYIKDESKSPLEIETEKIQKILNNNFINNTEYDLKIFDKTSFKKISFYENFMYEKNFKEIVLNKLTELLSSDFPNIGLSSSKELENIYWKDISSNRHFIFDITVSSQKYGFTRVFSIYLILNNINNYLFDNGKYIPGIIINNSDISIKYIIENITKQTEKLLQGTVYGVPDQYYKIQNELNLLDPFITSGKSMQITDEIKQNFEKVLQEKTTVLQKYSTGNCFDNNNNIIVTDKNTNENKTKCESSDVYNKWDTLPFNDFDCPFYEKNKNYPNTFGKLTNDKCEMPLNTKQQGFRFYSLDPKYAPLCYNCKTDRINDKTSSSLGTCCDKQLNKMDYPELITPDYAFPNDNLLRKKYKNIFDEKNLNYE
jgi:hypothetical protein